MGFNWKKEKFQGVFVALNACYEEDGSVSKTRMKKFVRFLADKGVQGVYVGGSTGEGFLQSFEDSKWRGA